MRVIEPPALVRVRLTVLYMRAAWERSCF